LIWLVFRALVRGEARRLLGPVLLAVSGAAVFALGCNHFSHGWPGTGGHPWADRGLVPFHVAALAWAGTLWVTSYWAHPDALSSFPAAEIVWMVVSPLALLAVLHGAGRIVRRLPLSAGVLRYEVLIGCGALPAMAVFLAGACSWVLSGGPAPRELFRVGAIDGVGVAVMGCTLLVGCQAIHRALMSRRAAQPVG